VVNFSVWPPEVNSVLLLEGPGSGPMLEAAAAWEGIYSELSSAATSFSSVTSDLTGQAWQGPASKSMTAAAAGYADWLGGAAAQAEQSAAQARAAVVAYEAALATIVDPGFISANRGQLVSLVRSNLFGQNAPWIAAAEDAYEQMWAQDVAAMSGYHANAAATVSQLAPWAEALENMPAEFAAAIEQTPSAVVNGFVQIGQTIFGDIFGVPAVPTPATQLASFNGNLSLATRFEEAALYPLKPLLAVTGLDTQISVANSPLLALFASDVPPLSWFLGNSPPPLLNLLLGETVSYSTSNGMSIVQITPSHPTGNYVVAIHGGAFIFPASFFHWIDYSVSAYTTGATYEVPIYPLIQQGGTAGVVVPAMAGFISSQIAQHGAPHVSVLGDSAGGNLALASVEYMLAQNPAAQVPSSMVLLSPWLDLGMTNPNIAFVQDPLLPVGPAQQLGRIWAGGLPMNDPIVSPLYGSLAGLPPTYVYSGSMDILAPDTLLLQQKAANALAPFTFVLANGEIHDWIILTLDGPQYWSQINQQLGI
jgi:triacylglycerol lipase